VQPTSATLRHSVVTITGPSGDPMQVIIPVGQTIGMVQGAVGNTLYSAVARAYDVYGNVSAATAAVNHTTAYDTVAPAVPTGLTVVAGIKNVLVGFTGVADSDLDHYDIAVSTNGGSTFPNVYSSKTTIAAITELVVGTTYTIKVRAVDRSGNASAYTSTASGVPRAATGSGTGGTDIAAGSIAATDIKAGSITIGKLGAEERGNLGSEFFTDFTDVSAWSPADAGSGGLVATAVSDAQAGQYVGRVGDNSGVDEYWAQRNDGLLIPFDPNSLYRVHVRVRRNSGTGVFYAGVEGVAADGTTLVNVAGANSFSSQHYVAAAGAAPGSSFTDYIGYIKGTSASPTAGSAKADPTAPGTVHSNVRYIRPMFLANYNNATGQMDLDLFEITRVDNTSVINSTGYVTINSSGITIINGALSFVDSYGTTAMDGGGFGPEWLAFIRSGFYNSSFTKGDTSDIAVTETGSGTPTANYVASITSHLPYWVVAASGGTLLTVSDSTASGGFALKSTASVAAQTNRWYQDVPITPGKKYLVRLNERWTVTAGDFALNHYYSWRDSTHALIGSRVGSGLTVSSTRAAYALDTDTQIPAAVGAAPANAVYLRYETEIVHNNTATTYWLDDVSLIEANADRAFRGAGAWRSTTQSTTTGVDAAISFDVEYTDTEAMFAPTSTTITIKVAGFYRLTGTLTFAGAAGGTRRILAIKVNGTTPTAPDGEQTMVNAGTAFDIHMSKSIVMNLAVGDAITLVANQNSGGNLNVQIGAMLMVEFLGFDGGA
jgi:hypothetical protein